VAYDAVVFNDVSDVFLCQSHVHVLLHHVPILLKWILFIHASMTDREGTDAEDYYNHGDRAKQ